MNEEKLKLDKEKLGKITEFLKEKVWRNPNVMFSSKELIEEEDIEMLTSIVSSLHNLLYEQVTGERYNYAFHWCNKIGSDTDDDIFDDLLKGE